MDWYYPPEQEEREVDQVFHRVHGNTAPRPGVDVAMMKVVGRPVQRLPVEKPVVDPEVDCGPQDHAQSGHHEYVGRVGDPVWSVY